MCGFPIHAAIPQFAEFFLFLNTGPLNTVLVNVTRPTVRAMAFAVNLFFTHAISDGMGVSSKGDDCVSHAFRILPDQSVTTIRACGILGFTRSVSSTGSHSVSNRSAVIV